MGRTSRATPIQEMIITEKQERDLKNQNQEISERRI